MPALKWRTVEDLRPHLDPIVAELGCMPTSRQLKERRRGDLHGAVLKFGGFPRVAEDLGYPYKGRLSWDAVEDLRPHLDPIDAELRRMPSQMDLGKRGRHDLNNAIHRFGGFAKVAEDLSYPYFFAPGVERQARWRSLETALLQVHRSQMLSAGQVMLILRHAGLLSTGRVMEIARRLQTTAGVASPALQAQLTLAAAMEDATGEDAGDVRDHDAV
ncbi:MAG: hypothetical protein M3R02_28750, partial [Chloroflexota bacterium]|nr:hypothetical protein [Chloroflexota bacterium]